MKARISSIFFVLLLITGQISCSSETGRTFMESETNLQQKTDTAIFGSGCFWCSQAVFESLIGVVEVKCGYAGGHTEFPDYEAVCTGQTGHAEVVQIVYQPDSISYNDLLDVFWLTHDPTTKNRQGGDIGTQYRSVIFYHNAEQKAIAEEAMKALDASGILDKPVVTEISPLKVFYEAEAYHQDYFRKNPGQGYCQAVIRPKMEKFRKTFQEKLKK